MSSLNLEVGDQIIFSVGRRMVEWAACESLFLGVFECLLGRNQTNNGGVVWLSFRSTRARLALASSLISSSSITNEVGNEINECAKLFGSITDTRNFFAHALYIPDEITGKMSFIIGSSLSKTKEVLRNTRKEANLATVNELCDTINRTQALYDRMYPALAALKQETNCYYLEMPPLHGASSGIQRPE